MQLGLCGVARSKGWRCVLLDDSLFSWPDACSLPVVLLVGCTRCDCLLLSYFVTITAAAMGIIQQSVLVHNAVRYAQLSNLFSTAVLAAVSPLG